VNFSNLNTAIAVLIAIWMTGCATANVGGTGPSAQPTAVSTSPFYSLTPPTPPQTYTPPTTTPAPTAPTNATTSLPTQPTVFSPITLNPTSVASHTYAYVGIVQSATFTVSGGGLTSMTFQPADPNATMTVSYDALGVPNSLTLQSANVSGFVNQNQALGTLNGTTTPASITAVQLDDITPSTTNSLNMADVVMSYTPSGGASSTFSYQSFGPWEYATPTGGSISWFSYGIPTATALPTTGTATYAGIAAGNYVDTGGTIYATTANMSATADFGAGTINFSTSSTNTVNTNTTTTAANPALDLTGTLTITGNNFTGSVQNPAGTISGNATGLFYGPGLTTATAKSVYQSPAELGGTYAATGTGGTMIGGFGGKAQ